MRDETVDSTEEYLIERCTPGDLTENEKLRCIELVRSGGAANMAAREIRLASSLAVARKNGMIVAVGAIKRVREYTALVAGKAGFDLPIDTPEMGYVSVDKPHRDKHLSTRIITNLLDGHQGPIFATTSDPKIKGINQRLGFAQEGNEWDSEQTEGAKVSLWVRGLPDRMKRGAS